ncbi:GNAT family N-acetyltransferase [Sediminibacillus massiliensis]|uniref:GNAT family N-acetyltransferase n=1 Tax=Sediminibacillus massiliensis TaxID=1926277 RepID=UPI00098881B9|nr:GNAT family N-acetyltransferase [Sediminibacillus massiliensis]
MVQLVELQNNDRHINQVADLYNYIWNYNDRLINERLVRHADYVGFKGLLLLSDDRELLGYVYGYHSLPGQYYRDLMESDLPYSASKVWFEDCFELVELGVHPLQRNKHFGRLLMEKLLEKVPYKKSVLTTQTNNTAARALYESSGWTVVKEPFYPVGKQRPFVIFGKQLK